MATLDVITLEDAKQRLGGSVTRANDDVGIQSDITALSALFDTTFGAVVTRTVTAETITKPFTDTQYPNRDRVEYNIPAWTELYPITGTPTSDDGTVTVRNAQFGRIELSLSSATTVTYDAGRYATTADVGEDFKSAFIIALRNWRQADQTAPYVPAGPDYPTPRTAFPTFAMPNAVTQMLSKYRRPVGIA